MSPACDCCGYADCIYEPVLPEGHDFCDRCEEVFPDEDLIGGPTGGMFCEICLEIVVEIITDEEML